MNSNQGHSGGFFSGFLWGALLGAGAVLLLNTKKGKKLLKSLTDEGADGLSNLEEFIADVVEEHEGQKSVPQEKKAEAKKPPKRTNGETRSHVKVTETPVVQEVLSSPRRFFKGIKKKA